MMVHKVYEGEYKYKDFICKRCNILHSKHIRWREPGKTQVVLSRCPKPEEIANGYKHDTG